MQGKNLGSLCALALASVAWQPVNASAAILGGDVTGGTTTGDFQLLATPPAAAGPDTFQSPNLIGFDEQQDVLLNSSLALDSGITLPAGTIVSSHYVVFDPLIGSSVEGFVDFEEPILAVLGTRAALDSTASLLGADVTSYSTSPAIGPESPGNDSVTVSPDDASRLLFRAGAISPGDHVRVLTGVIPEPRTLLMAALAVGGLALVGFRDRHLGR